MYFQDSTPYCYGTFYGPDRIIPLDEVRMIGWLENGYDYPRGQVDEQTLVNLRKLLIMSPRSAKRAKGFHYCDFCNPPGDWESRPKITFEGSKLFLGSAQIWLPSATSPQLIYAAPNLIYHYIVEHGYRPPDEFLDAVNSFDLDSNWNAFEQYETLLEKHRERIRNEEQHS
jgi:hypothetical protein